MSEPEKSLQEFLARWSRRKRAAPEGDDEKPTTPGDAPESAPATIAGDAASAAAAAFDPASLPPIESITAATDIRAFLAPGVPLELTRAALRRAWVSDPAIRDFVGIAENQWDFTKPDEIPGFGLLDSAADLHRLMVRLSGDAPAEPAPAPAAARDGGGSEAVGKERAAGMVTDAAAPQGEPNVDDPHAAAQDEGTDAAIERTSGRGPHGRALPK